jgi:hypothetical protein
MQVLNSKGFHLRDTLENNINHILNLSKALILSKNRIIIKGT